MANQLDLPFVMHSGTNVNLVPMCNVSSRITSVSFAMTSLLASTIYYNIKWNKVCCRDKINNLHVTLSNLVKDSLCDFASLTRDDPPLNGPLVLFYWPQAVPDQGVWGSQTFQGEATDKSTSQVRIPASLVPT